MYTYIFIGNECLVSCGWQIHDVHPQDGAAPTLVGWNRGPAHLDWAKVLLLFFYFFFSITLKPRVESYRSL